jgi:hypothetical protein
VCLYSSPDYHSVSNIYDSHFILRVEVRLVLQQQSHRRLMPVPGRPVQRRPSVLIFRVDVRPVLQQHLHRRPVPVFGRPVQCRPSRP